MEELPQRSEKVEVPPQDDAKLRTAANDLAHRYPADEVVTYFLTLLLQDSGVWKGLVGWLEGTVNG